MKNNFLRRVGVFFIATLSISSNVFAVSSVELKQMGYTFTGQKPELSVGNYHVRLNYSIESDKYTIQNQGVKSEVRNFSTPVKLVDGRTIFPDEVVYILNDPEAYKETKYISSTDMKNDYKMKFITIAGEPRRVVALWNSAIYYTVDSNIIEVRYHDENRTVKLSKPITVVNGVTMFPDEVLECFKIGSDELEQAEESLGVDLSRFVSLESQLKESEDRLDQLNEDTIQLEKELNELLEIKNSN